MEATGRRYIAHPSRSDEITIWNMGDFHWMNSACAENRLKKDIKKIRDDPYSFFVGTGDYLEWITPSDRCEA